MEHLRMETRGMGLTEQAKRLVIDPGTRAGGTVRERTGGRGGAQLVFTRRQVVAAEKVR
jgi:hypothetical protein